MDQPLLRVDITVDYPDHPAVLDGLHLEIGDGEIVGLAGQSGSGKSTLGLAIPRLLGMKRAKIRGEIRFRERDLLLCSEGEMRRLRGKELGVVFQGASSALNPALSLGTQLREAWRAHRGWSTWKAAREPLLGLLHSMELPGDDDFLGRYPAQISIGQAQRVLIALAVMHRPALVIADEPTSALDMVTQAGVLQLLRSLRDRFSSSVLFITHDLAAAGAVCDRICILREGQIVESGPPAGIFMAPRHPYTRSLIDAMPVPIRDLQLSAR